MGRVCPLVASPELGTEMPFALARPSAGPRVALLQGFTAARHAGPRGDGHLPELDGSPVKPGASSRLRPHCLEQVLTNTCSVNNCSLLLLLL